MSEILIVDDDDQLRNSFSRLLAEEGHTVRTAPSGEAGVKAVKSALPDLVIMDVKLPGISGLEAFAQIRKVAATLPVIVMTAYGTTDTAIEAMKLGAFDYILKPFDIPAVLDLIERALEAGRLMHSRVKLGGEPADTAGNALIGRSQAMQEVYKSIGRVARTDATVLIRGESGTGKELVARAIYQHSLRAGKSFLVINCVALPETLLESELFGYERGAFTGAAGQRVGKVEQANGGTILLDEIGDMPLSIQAKILRLLQERSIERLGGRRPIAVDVRILAATNRDLEKAMSAGQFREDLYYRLRVVTLTLPPLRERREDVPLLCDYFMAGYSREMGIPNPGITDAAKAVIGESRWPGNVRELSNTLKKALILSGGYPVRPEDISYAISPDGCEAALKEGLDSIEQAARQWIRSVLLSDEQPDKFNYFMDTFGSLVISEALQLTGDNRSQAAKLLGLARPTLLSKIEKLNLTTRVMVRGSSSLSEQSDQADQS